ncbi:MAG: 50S ribosomal protein L35 [Phycisphaerae bacterium]|nr:50S ribosomal protein L35 [Phycisphaerae bacterium]
MPKQKTNKAVAKRVKITGSGKIKRYGPGSGHLKSRKNNKQLRSFRKVKDVSKAFTKQAKRMLGM